MQFEVIILSYNRPELLRQCLTSWLTQDLSETRILVSDNSTNDEAWQMMNREFPQVEKRRIQASLASVDHFNFCRQQAQGSWYALFHDDDIMLENGWLLLKAVAIQQPKAIAIAGNAVFVRGQNLTTEIYNPKLTAGQVANLSNGLDLFANYCSPTTTHQPFPAYLYNHQLAGKIPFEVKSAGKYSDTCYLMGLAESGQVLWVGDPTMGYRTHGQNDSGKHSLLEAFQLYRFAKKLLDKKIVDGSLESSSIRFCQRQLALFRHWQLLLHLRQNLRSGAWGKNKWRQRIVVLHLLKYFILHPGVLYKKLSQLVCRKFHKDAPRSSGNIST